MAEDARAFPDWEALYQNQRIESMPWYNESLDADLESELEGRKIHGGKFLDIGTGPGTQAMRLYERGFTVTASDLSEAAIMRASIDRDKAAGNINFVVDNILNSAFREANLTLYLTGAAFM